MDDADAGSQCLLRPGEIDPAAEHLDMPFVRPVDPGEYLSQRALACAVLAAQRVAGTGGDGEAHTLEREDSGKALGDVVEADGWVHEGCKSGVIISSTVLSIIPLRAPCIKVDSNAPRGSTGRRTTWLVLGASHSQSPSL